MADKDFKVKAGLDLGTPLPLTEGGTGQTSASNALNAILPVQTSQANKFLQTDGTSTSWAAAAVANNPTFTGSSIVIPSGTTAERPASPVTGAIRLNTTSGTLEFYTGTAWGSIATFPQPPTSLVATNVGTSRAYNNGSASVAFTTAAADGGSTITGYTITSNPGSFTATGATSPIVVTGLQSATSYTFTGTATNSIGVSTVSSASSSITATTVPQTPTPGTATATNTTTASLTFTAGATGGSTITNYKYSTDGTNYTALSPAQTTSPLSIAELTPGASYTFYIKAVNANGDSAASVAYSSLTMPFPVTPSIEYIVLAGGGGGAPVYNGGGGGGGGGAGGMLVGASQAVSPGRYDIVVGTGGTAGTKDGYTGTGAAANSGGSGNSSSFGNLLSATGGGGGGGDRYAGADNYGSIYWAGGHGANGGSGGGSASPQFYGGGDFGTGIAGQGTSGSYGTNNYGGGAGGGATNAASQGDGGNGKAGFDGVVRAGGGGGGKSNNPGGNGGSGGGGAGAGSQSSNATSGSAQLGGGGGGLGSGNSRSGGAGGSGIVKIRYASNYAAPNAVTGSPSVTNTGGYRTYTWTGSGSVTF